MDDFERETADEAYATDLNIEDDFNIDDEYQPSPLVPQGTYHANVTSVKFNPEQQSIIWEVTLAENGGYLSDARTPVDGVKLFYTNWLPRRGDENEMTASGRSTKRQSKINMLSDFAKVMKVNMSTPAAIVSALQNGDWIGLSVDVKISTREYEGRVYNDVKKMWASHA